MLFELNMGRKTECDVMRLSGRRRRGRRDDGRLRAADKRRLGLVSPYPNYVSTNNPNRAPGAFLTLFLSRRPQLVTTQSHTADECLVVLSSPFRFDYYMTPLSSHGAFLPNFKFQPAAHVQKSTTSLCPSVLDW